MQARAPARVGAVRRRPARHRGSRRPRGRLRDRPARRPGPAAPAHARQRRRDRRGGRPRSCTRWLLVRRYRPRVVVGFGGYASLPCVAAARVLARADARARAGRRARASRTASACASARAPRCRCPDTPLRDATLTGNPVRSSIAAIVRRARARSRAGGGRTAARRARARSTAPRSAATTAGATARDLDGAPRVRAAQRRRVRGARSTRSAEPDDALATSSCPTRSTWPRCSRARRSRCAAPGAGTIAELTVAGVPAVLVPLPGSPSDHQTRNAQTLERGGRGGGRARRRVRRRAARRASSTALLADPARLDADGRGRAAARPARRRRAGRRSRRGAARVPDDSAPADDRRSRRSISPDRVACTSSASAASGMSAIALLLARMGHEVSGSDLKESVALARLEAAGVQRAASATAPRTCPRDADAVVYSTAIPARNVELVAARELGIPVLHRSAALAALAATRRTIAVAGSHGKTTTSSMLALILRSAGWQPSFVIGGEVNEVGANAAYGAGEWLVVEADESDGTFLRARPRGRDRHQRRARPPRLLRRVRRAHRRVRAVRRRGARRRSCAAPTTWSPRSIAARAAARAHLRLRARRRLPDRRRSTLAGDVDRFTLVGRRRARSASSSCRWR